MTRLFLLVLMLLNCVSCKEIKQVPVKPNAKDSINIDTMPNVNVAAGRVHRIADFPSKNVSPRHIDVLLPPSYDSTLRYPVLYMHDGQMLLDRNKTWNQQEWGVDDTLLKLIKNKRIDPIIVVGIWNIEELRMFDYLPQKPFLQVRQSWRDSLEANMAAMDPPQKLELRADAYLKFIVNELKPFIDNNYSTYKDAKNTAIAGSSMGGLISWYAHCEYPEVFGSSASISTHWPGLTPEDNNPIPDAFFAYLSQKLPSNSSHKFYFDFGDQTLDQHYPQYAPLLDSIFKAVRYDSQNYVNYYFEGAAHDEAAWQKRLYHPLLFLFEKK